MKKSVVNNIVLVIFFKSIVTTIGFAQSNIQEFYLLFEEAEFDVLQIHLRDQNKSILTSTYPFKGTKIDSSFYDFLAAKIASFNDNADFFATYRFYIKDDLEALIVREYAYGNEQYIHCFFYDNTNQKLLKSTELCYQIAGEGAYTLMESWVLDLNKDGQKDFLSRSFREACISTLDGDCQSIFEENLVLSFWQEGELFQTEITDTTLRKQLEEDFPYYQLASPSYDTEQNLIDFLQTQTDVEVNQSEYKGWFIIAGSDKNLESAEYELKRAREVIGFKHKYDLSITYFNIHHKNDWYYTVIEYFDTRIEAEIALLEVKKVFNETAYVIKKSDWCENLEHQRMGYYKCTENLVKVFFT